MLIIDFDPKSAPQYVKQGYSIVVVDVLRATSTIIVAIERGAQKIFPCVEIEDTIALRNSHGALLAGERGGEKIKDFDFTNSPHDLSQNTLCNLTIAITTSTGTKLIAASTGSPNILIGSTLNAKSVAQKMKMLDSKWAIIGAGSHGEFRPEDKVGCALIALHYLEETNFIPTQETMRFVKEYSSNIEHHITHSPSTEKLLRLGRARDVNFVLKNVNQYTQVPVARNVQERGKEYLVITHDSYTIL